MIVILYDPECQITNGLALKIKLGIGSECILMNLDNVDNHILNLAKCIIFGCRTGFSPGVSEAMLNFMNNSRGQFENQIWKNKFAAGFTSDTGLNASRTIEDLCNFASKHSMLWIPQGHLAETEGLNMGIINKNKSFLGCISLPDQDQTAYCFGLRIANIVRSLR